MLGLKIVGFKAIHKIIDDFSRKALSEAEKKMWKAVLMLERDAKITCTEMRAIDTGRLRASIQGLVFKTPNGFLGEVSSPVHYAIYVHEGTCKMAARPFLKAALTKDERKIYKLLEDTFKDISVKFVKE